MSRLFADDPLSEILAVMAGAWAEPPDRIPLRILGLAAKPTTRDAVKSAFRTAVMKAHPDLAAYTDPGLRQAAEAVAGQTPEVRELVWARDVLLNKVPAPVTGNGAPHANSSTRHEPQKCKACANPWTDASSYLVGGYSSGGWMRWRGYCEACAREAEKARRRELRAARRANRTCALCGATFTPPRSDGRYCSAKCRQKAYRRRASDGGP